MRRYTVRSLIRNIWHWVRDYAILLEYMNIPPQSSEPTFVKQESIVFWAIQASIDFLTEKEPNKIKVLKEFSSRVSQRDYRSETEMIDDFIGFLDIFFIDQISDQREYALYDQWNRPCLSLYARDRNFENVTCAIWNENYTCESIIRIKGVLSINDQKTPDAIYMESENELFEMSWTEPLDKLIYISQPLSFQEYDDFFYKVFTSWLPINWIFLVVWWIDIWNNVTIQFLLHEKIHSEEISNRYLSQFNYSDPEDAITHPDIQSIFRAFLTNWRDITGQKISISPLSSWVCESTSMEVSNLVAGDFSHSSNSTKRRLQKIWPLRIGITESQTVQFLRKHIQHYERFFQDPILWKPQVSLASSWAWVNNVVARVLKKYIPEKEEWTGINFYYENQMPFWSEEVTKNTRVLGLCPTLLIPRWNYKEEGIEEGSYPQLEQFLLNARENPQNNYFIFVDITARIEQNISQIIHDVPSNVTIIATASLTKHQRNGVNYFFGSIAVYNNTLIHQEIQQMIRQIIGGLTTDQVLALPRIRKSEAIQNSINRKKNQWAFESWFVQILSEHPLLPPPRLIHNDFGTFILTPMPEILYFMKYGIALRVWKSIWVDDLVSLIQVDHIEEKSPIWFLANRVPSFMLNELLDKSWIILRDSFWFEDNSCSSVFMPYASYFEWEESDISVKKVDTIRISFWYKLNEEKSNRQWVIFALGYLEYMYNLIGFPYEPKGN